jgi:hypothetical protein
VSCLILDNQDTFSLENLESIPQFNFSNSLLNSDFFSVNNNNELDVSPYSDLNIQCNYMDVNSFISMHRSVSNFSFFSLNIQSIHAKFTEFEDLINNLNSMHCAPDVILLQEIWQVQCVNSVSLNNYSELVFKSRSNNVQGGGVGIYFRNNVKFNILREKSIFSDRVIETIFAEVWITPQNKIIVGSIYRPSVNHPTLTSSEQFSQFFELFTNILNDFSERNVPVYIFGDFNLDVLKYNIVRQVTDYIDLLFSYGFLQLIMKPTRCSPSSASIIDHFVTNCNADIYKSIILTNKISDHFPFIAYAKSVKPIPSTTTMYKRIFSNYNFLKFNEAFHAINWDFLSNMDCVDDQFLQFSDTFNTLYNLYFPITSYKINKNYQNLNPRMTKGLLVSRRTL